MNTFWNYFWPCFAAGIVAGVIAGVIAFHRGARRKRVLAIGVSASLALAALWHGPIGGADRLERRVDRNVKEVLAYYEMPQVTGHLHRGPLSRRLVLSGPADDFQRSELVRLLNQLPGVRETVWNSDGGGLPLIVEGLGVALLGFLFGLLLAYLIELHRRYNAQWNW